MFLKLGNCGKLAWAEPAHVFMVSVPPLLLIDLKFTTMPVLTKSYKFLPDAQCNNVEEPTRSTDN